MTVYDLRCGNIINYTTEDGEILPIVVDWRAIKWLSEDPKGFNKVHSPIKLNESILLQQGCVISYGKREDHFRWLLYPISGHFYKKAGITITGYNGRIKFYHELQNYLYEVNAAYFVTRPNVMISLPK